MEDSPSACDRPGPRKNSVKIRRISAGALVMLLLCVSSYAAACDLSCGFALFRSDCHSPEMAAADSGASDIRMTDMKIPEIAGEGSTSQRLVHLPPQSMPAHSVLADMGACERQSCDQGQAIASRADHSTAAQFDTISTVAETPYAESLRVVFHEGRKNIPPFGPFGYSPLDISLRI
jgi:hypothetical protein